MLLLPTRSVRRKVWIRGAQAIALAVGMCVTVGAWSDGQGDAVLQLIRQEKPPRFKKGHTLPRLCQWGPELSVEVRLELAERWGYAVQFGRLRPELVEALAKPDSAVSRLCREVRSRPDELPLQVIVAPAFSVRAYIEELPKEAFCLDAEGNLVEGKKIWSPEAPDAVFERIADYEVAMLREVAQHAPIAYITNGGEYALSTVGHDLKYWEQDPRVAKARGDRDWYEYISERKAHQEMIITERIRKAFPSRKLYIYYATDACPHRGRYPGWEKWAWDYKFMRPVSDIPNTSLYFGHYNTGWGGQYDMLTMALNTVAQQIAVGEPLSYNWTCAGWPTAEGERRWVDPPISDVPHYIGYLKCFYTAGMIGGVAGYFAYDAGENWIWQYLALSQVHALFSHLEEFLREGDLLPGPQNHRWSKDLPAYEFPTGDPTVRVLARKHRQRPEWLVTAWAAQGEAREAEGEIPQLGKVKVFARPEGSVYLARLEEGQPKLKLLDQNGLLPTDGFTDGQAASK
jgi:hypothetical protein